MAAMRLEAIEMIRRSRRRKRMHAEAEVQLNMAAMLAPLLIGRFDNIQPTEPVSKSASYGLASWGPSVGSATLTVYFSIRVFWTADRKGRKRHGSGNVLSESNLTE